MNLFREICMGFSPSILPSGPPYTQHHFVPATHSSSTHSPQHSSHTHTSNTNTHTPNTHTWTTVRLSLSHGSCDKKKMFLLVNLNFSFNDFKITTLVYLFMLLNDNGFLSFFNWGRTTVSNFGIQI